jgi:elongation of very long chain fatty acids protein 6
MTAFMGSIYVILVFTGQAWMASRPAYQLRGPLAAWSAFLAVFSICGFLRVFPEFVHSLTTGGIYHSVCNSNFIEQNKVSGFWAFLFTLSKMPELGDTLFIVLRKQQLIFLHWSVSPPLP